MRRAGKTSLGTRSTSPKRTTKGGTTSQGNAILGRNRFKALVALKVSRNFTRGDAEMPGEVGSQANTSCPSDRCVFQTVEWDTVLTSNLKTQPQTVSDWYAWKGERATDRLTEPRGIETQSPLG